MARRPTLAYRAAVWLAGCLIPCLVTWLVLGPGTAGAETIAVFPVERGTRETAAAELVEEALYLELQGRARVVERQRTREALRRMRLRAPGAAEAETLRRVAADLAADRLLAPVLQDAPRGPAPDLTLSARLFEGASGELRWIGFQGVSGLDGRTLLGLGAIERLDALAPVVVRRLLETAPISGAPGDGRAATAPSRPTAGRWAVVPFTAYVEVDAYTAAWAGTEATRAMLHRAGAAIAAPSCVDRTLRRNRARVWGEMNAAVRRGLREDCGAERLLTGSIERWEIGGTGLEPEPRVAVALRALDAATGRILWMNSEEAGGWDRQRLFALGRVHSRGALLDRMVTRLGRELFRVEPLAPEPD